MKKIIKYATIALFVVVLAIQAIPVERTNPPVITDVDAPLEVKQILRESCYDCHSNETEWPWYSYVAPISWLVAHDVNEGREELNFSEWDAHRGDEHVMEEIIEETAEGEMPMPIYLLTHADAEVDAREMEILKQWTGVSGQEGEDHHDHDEH